MVRKSILVIAFIILIWVNYANAVGFTSADLFTSDGSSSTDAKTFVNRALAMDIDSTNIMVACFDYSNTNCNENPTYDECFAASQADFDDCAAYDSWLDGMGYNYDSDPGSHNMPVTSAITTCADARYYKNCDGTGSGNLYGVTQKRYYVFSKRKFDCDAGSPSWYTYDAEGGIGSSDYDYNDEISCPTYRKCSEDDDDDYVFTYNGAIPDVCRLDDGSTSNYACSADSECWSNDCSGAISYVRFQCLYDGSNDIDRDIKSLANTCGGSGYITDDWGSGVIDRYYCTDGDLGGTGYVCDVEHDQIQVVVGQTEPVQFHN